MLNITVDTCVWLELLKIDFNNEDNLLEELCYWIEQNHITHVVPTNIIVEWNRRKLTHQSNIAAYFRKAEQDKLNFLKNNKELSSTYQPDTIDSIVQKRIERIDLILNVISSQAPIDDIIIKEAAQRNLQTLAPNHKKDSFRDTINILSLVGFLKTRTDSVSLFTTLNLDDFSASKSKRHDLHEQLKAIFAEVNLTYIYFDENENFGSKLFSELRSKYRLPNFQQYLKEKHLADEEQILGEKKLLDRRTTESVDKDYLENLRHIDIALKKKNPTEFEKDMVRDLISRHESYKQYFFSKVGNDGLV